MTVRRQGWCVLAALVLCGGAAWADSIEADFSGDALRASYTRTHERRGFEFDFGLLHASDEGDVGSAGFHVLGLTGPARRPLEAGVGGRLFLLDTDAGSGAALGLGGYLRHGFRRPERLELKAHMYYAPSALGFSGAERYFEAGLRAAYRIHTRASIYLGWRMVDVRFEDQPSVEVDRGLHAGLHIGF